MLAKAAGEIEVAYFTAGLIAKRLIRRIDHAVIDPKDFTEGFMTEGD